MERQVENKNIKAAGRSKWLLVEGSTSDQEAGIAIHRCSYLLRCRQNAMEVAVHPIIAGIDSIAQGNSPSGWSGVASLVL